MWGEAICIGIAIIVAGAVVSAELMNLRKLHERILKRYAALGNLGLFPPDPEDDPDFYAPCAICGKSNVQGHKKECPNTPA